MRINRQALTIIRRQKSIMEGIERFSSGVDLRKPVGRDAYLTRMIRGKLRTAAEIERRLLGPAIRRAVARSARELRTSSDLQ